MKSKLEKAIDYIGGYCRKHDYCDNCLLVDKTKTKCMLKQGGVPDWYSGKLIRSDVNGK